MLKLKLFLIFQGIILGVVGVISCQTITERNVVSGKKFAQNLAVLASSNNGIVKLGNPDNILQRICFEPSGTFGGSSLSEFFPNIPIVYRETYDSNLWYVGFFTPERGGLIILGIPHNELEWNDYSSTQPESNFDPRAKAGCFGEVRITRSPNTDSLLFRPNYQTMWDK